MDFEECQNKRIAKEVQPDQELIKSLFKTSQNKLDSEKQLPLTQTTSSSKISLAYDALREILEALALKNRFKIYNHECYVYFLKEILNKSNLGDQFDDIRKVRNRVNYYGKELTIEETKQILEETHQLIKEIKKL
ncbi:MAG: hypothetical protein KAT77_03230 [Nanoarchaeota archaeon]|nr:hypothetical protein [Nanoarchaeota archaeon]